MSPPIPADLIESMAEAAWNRHANVPWKEFFVGDRASAKEFYLQAMRAAADTYRQYASQMIAETIAGVINDMGSQ